MISVRHLRKSYGELHAVDDISFSVESGKIMALLGANGAGKSTAVHLLLGLIAADSGKVEISGYDVFKNSVAVRSLTAYVPDRLSLYPHLTGLENLIYFYQVGSGRERPIDEFESILVQMGLDQSVLHQPASTYSKGMCQKVGLAIALAKEAKVLLLDEPLSGLDPKAANEFCSKLRVLANQGVSILMATHDLFRAHETAHHIGIMKSGRLTATLKSDDIDAYGLEKLYMEQMK